MVEDFFWKNRKICLQNKITILEATVMTVIEYGSKTWVFGKMKKHLIDILQMNCQQIILVVCRGNQKDDC